jgi:hypothetical protein
VINNAKTTDVFAWLMTGEDIYDKESGILTVQAVFRDDNDTTDKGMEIDDLIDVIHGMLVYFPAYACTSFTVSHPYPTPSTRLITS